MSLAQVRADLVTLLAPLVADGGEVTAYTPDAVNVVPSIWLGDATARIHIAMSDVVYDYRLPVTCAVARKAIYAEERAAATEMLQAMIALLVDDVQLGGMVNMMQPEELREGAIGPIGGETLVGFTIFLAIKQKIANG